MKKLIIVLIAFLAYLPLSGFASVGFGAVSNSNSTINEYVAFEYSETTLAEIGISDENFQEFLTNISLGLKTVVAANLESQVRADNTLTPESKQKLLNGISVSATFSEKQLVLSVLYGSSSYRDYFANSTENTTVELKTSFFTINRVVTSKPSVTKLEINGEIYPLPRAVYNYVKNQAVIQFGNAAETALQNPQYSYAYATTKHRIHSDANLKSYYNGFYYHTWNIEDINSATIKTYTTHANSTVWYLLALGLTAVFAVVIWLVGVYANKNSKNGSRISSPKSLDIEASIDPHKKMKSKKDE